MVGASGGRLGRTPVEGSTVSGDWVGAAVRTGVASGAAGDAVAPLVEVAGGRSAACGEQERGCGKDQQQTRHRECRCSRTSRGPIHCMPPTDASHFIERSCGCSVSSVRQHTEPVKVPRVDKGSADHGWFEGVARKRPAPTVPPHAGCRDRTRIDGQASQWSLTGRHAAVHLTQTSSGAVDLHRAWWGMSRPGAQAFGQRPRHVITGEGFYLREP